MSKRMPLPPLTFIACLTAVVSIAIGIILWRGALPATWGSSIHWGLAAAALTFTLAQMIHSKRASRAELGLLVLAPCSLISHYFVIAAGALVVISVLAWIVDELF